MKVWIIVDGKREAKEFIEGFTIKELLDHLHLDETLFWIARNRVMLKKDSYPRVTLKEGDVIEIFRIMSGG